jgi:hypothetical protein
VSPDRAVKRQVYRCWRLYKKVRSAKTRTMWLDALAAAVVGEQGRASPRVFGFLASLRAVARPEVYRLSPTGGR